MYSRRMGLKYRYLLQILISKNHLLLQVFIYILFRIDTSSSQPNSIQSILSSIT